MPRRVQVPEAGQGLGHAGDTGREDPPDLDGAPAGGTRLGQEWKDKLAGGFTHSASQNGDKLFSLQQLAVFAAQMNMQWISVGDAAGNNWTGGTVHDVNRLGSWLGVMGQTNVDEGPDEVGAHGDMVTAERYGARVAELTARWVHGRAYEIRRNTLEDFREISARSAAEAKART
ncbi:hypothetical protein ACGF5O_35400 [Streptomyces sp. NPDC048291]|uniref:hypothetical protein n=1 Tax=Streptomyces sp. NPDC048291 TaxID=3365530 RepID=UPI003724A5A1